MENTAPRLLDEDTVAAIATAAGRGSIGIVRLSGKESRYIAEKMTGKILSSRQVIFSHIQDLQGRCIDNGLILFFEAPNSFTGEDVVEFQAHGNYLVLDQILNTCLAHGARMARPGEFSERAFLNNKIDLIQAEAIADLIAAETLVATQSALASLQGAFSKEVNAFVDQLIALRAYVEAALDFPEEEVDFLSSGKIAEKLSALEKQLGNIFNAAKQGSLITEGMTLVIAGRPNAGKSSLLNALAGRDSAIVTPIPGTTRDVLREHIQIDGMPLHIVDTAGLRENTNDPIEEEGIKRALKEIKKADRILLIIDSNDPSGKNLSLKDIWPEKSEVMQNEVPVIKIYNKCDTSGLSPEKGKDFVTLSAKTGAGISLLKEFLKESVGFAHNNSGRYSARRRHLQGLQETAEHIATGQKIIFQQLDSVLLAEELRLAQRSLEVITGRFTPDDLLDKIFRDFCIGK